MYNAHTTFGLASERPNGGAPAQDQEGQSAVSLVTPRAIPVAAGAAAAPAATAASRLVRSVDVDPTCVDPHLAAITRLDFAATSEYQRLAVSLILGAAERPFRRVLVASAGHGDGRTTVAINLATALAEARRRVLLVDADLERPSVCSMLRLEAEVGLAEALDGGLPLEAATVRVEPCGFDLVPLRGPVANQIATLSSPEFQAMLAAADAEYDFVLLDAPPLSEGATIGILARLVDTTLLVVRPGATTSADLARAIAPLTQDSLFGVVLNRTVR